MPARDAGVPWPGDVYTVGDQYDYDQSHEWEDDDAPGCGASYSDMEMKALRGGATRSLGHSEVAKLMRMVRQADGDRKQSPSPFKVSVCRNNPPCI